MFEAIIEITGAEGANDFQVLMRDGDIEVGILPASVGEWRFIAVCTYNKPECLIDEEVDSLNAAVKRLGQYLIDEYPEEV